MRIQRVVARAFGPFRDEILALAPGMTVIAGPNEAGKSSWHAAMRLALTGVRRGRGRTTGADVALAERHRPWDGSDRWEVEARLSLDDGRTIDIQQDLAGKVACKAVDIGLARDVSDEILDGTPDASRWLGLDRDSFAATVSVSQAEIMAVADAADTLQEQMQRAAATRGTDATAAQAIERLMEFRREAIGADTVAAKGPLRTARRRLAEATRVLEDAVRLHGAYLERAERSDEAEDRLVSARGAHALVAAAQALSVARRSAVAADRAAVLAERHPRRPADLAERDALADQVAGAIEGWVRRPAPVQLSGPTSAQLAQELAALPPPPGGDLQPDPALAAQRQELDRIEQAIELLGEAPDQAEPEVTREEIDRMRALARRMRSETPSAAAELERTLSASRAAAAAPPRLPRALAASLLVIAVAVVAAVGVGLLAGGLLAAAGLAILGWAWLADAPRREATRLVAGAEGALEPYRRAAERAEEERRAAAEECGAHGWPGDADALDQLADRLALVLHDAARIEQSREQREQLRVRRQQAGAALLAALAERGITDGTDPRLAWAGYEAACRRRAADAEHAARAEPLRRELASRRAAEESAAEVLQASADAERRLRDAATAIGADPALEPDLIVGLLRGWQAERSAELRANQQAIEEWRELEGLLAGRQLSDLQREAEERGAAARQAASGLDPAAVEAVAARPDLERELVAQRERVAAAERAAHELRGALAMQRAGLPDVAEAEESAAAARAELDRITSLASVVDETLQLLRAAQERVHRDLAPVLAQAVQRWLPHVSGGSYLEVSVDPADLQVRVKEAGSGIWREARLLSAGTREQIYLLLRVAMAEHLVTTGETAPLLLDEVTAQADAERRAGLLTVLHALSRERQVVLFSHDDEVAAWAERTLVEPDDRLVRLPARPRASAPVAAEAPPAVAVAVVDELPLRLPA